MTDPTMSPERAAEILAGTTAPTSNGGSDPEAADLTGKVFHQSGQDIIARMFQHEIDHLDGRLLIDRMGSVSRLTNRRVLKQLETQYAKR